VQWYYVSEGERLGPYEDDAFALLVREAEVVPDTLVWHEGMADWVPYAKLAAPSAATRGSVEAAEALAAPGHRICVECGHPYEEGAGLVFGGSQVCAQCKPIFFARLAEGTLNSSQVQYAGFWIRFVAKVVDNCLLGVCNMVIVGFFLNLVPTQDGPMVFTIFQGLSAFFGFVMTLAYCTWFVGRFGATPGKMIFGLEIVRPGGGTISYPRALGRTFAEFVSAFTLYIGYIIAAFDEEKRSLHDHICDTRVIRST
jgi:uncharacterized RDD family membrane protein YckC